MACDFFSFQENIVYEELKECQLSLHLLEYLTLSLINSPTISYINHWTFDLFQCLSIPVRLLLEILLIAVLIDIYICSDCDLPKAFPENQFSS